MLDDALDRIDWVTHQLCNYGIPQTNDVLKEYSYLILLATTEISGAVGSLSTLKNPDDVKTHVTEISRLYNLSTELLSRAVLELFKTKDLLMIIKLMTLNMAKQAQRPCQLERRSSGAARGAREAFVPSKNVWS